MPQVPPRELLCNIDYHSTFAPDGPARMRIRRDPHTRAIAFGAESGRCRWRAPISTRIETAKSSSPAATLDLLAAATIDLCRARVFLLWGCRLISLVLSVLRRVSQPMCSSPLTLTPNMRCAYSESVGICGRGPQRVRTVSSACLDGLWRRE